MTLSSQIRTLLTASEKSLFSKLDSPTKIQNFLEGIPVNYEWDGETNYSPRFVIQKKVAHCFEGAVFAAAVLAFHGQEPLLMDFATDYDDEDHAVALFKDGPYIGAISKTNHALLRYRDAVYKTPRELAMSYFHEYYMHDGRKSLRGYSAPFKLARFSPERWVTSNDIDWLHTHIQRGRYFDVTDSKRIKKLRKASPIELKSLDLLEWPKTRPRT